MTEFEKLKHYNKDQMSNFLATLYIQTVLTQSCDNEYEASLITNEDVLNVLNSEDGKFIVESFKKKLSAEAE